MSGETRLDFPEGWRDAPCEGTSPCSSPPRPRPVSPQPSRLSWLGPEGRNRRGSTTALLGWHSEASLFSARDSEPSPLAACPDALHPETSSPRYSLRPTAAALLDTHHPVPPCAAHEPHFSRPVQTFSTTADESTEFSRCLF